MAPIVLLGDSILARTTQDNTTALLPRLQTTYSSKRILAYAIGGSNSSDCLKVVESLTLPRGCAVIISLGMNDAAPWKKVPLMEFTANYKRILSLLHRHKIILLTPYPVHADRQQKPGRSNTEIEAYAYEVKRLAAQHSVAVIDMNSIIAKDMAKQDMHGVDGVHLNNLGYTTMYKYVDSELQRSEMQKLGINSINA